MHPAGLLVILSIFHFEKLLAARKKKESNKWKESPLMNATHYWNMDGANGKYALDWKKKQLVSFVNDVSLETQGQLGKVLQLDGRHSWVEVPELEDRCITKVQCNMGITVSFWMKYQGGDYIMAAGKYVATEQSPGFRMQRDPESKFFVLEVSDQKDVWRIFIKDLPKTWFHFAFTWRRHQRIMAPNEGLKVYIDGYLKLERLLPSPIQKDHGVFDELDDNTNDERDLHKITFGKIGALQEFDGAGKFQLGHLAIWKRALGSNEMKEVYEANVKQESRYEFCCASKQMEEDACSKWDLYDCICTNLKKEKYCPNKALLKAVKEKGCVNENPHCDKLVNCNNYSPGSIEECYLSCKCMPVARLMTIQQPKKHFTQEALIFALLGCIGGLIMLFGIMFYFWKIYRTRYHGAFVPPSKSNSLLDIPPEYEDMKWSNKHDTSSFYIKDVPSKKRALPLISAHKNSQVYRYQPPEFE